MSKMENKKRLMLVDDFKKNLCHYCNTYMSEEPCEPNECWVHDVIAQTDTVDAVEVVHGRLGVSYMDEYYGEFADCLECGTDNILPCHYCRNCGAKMDGDGNG